MIVFAGPITPVFAVTTFARMSGPSKVSADAVGGSRVIISPVWRGMDQLGWSYLWKWHTNVLQLDAKL